MICKNCHTENITKAKFCQHCGSAFTDEQREEAYDRTIFGMIDKLEKWKGYITLEAITGHPVFKTLILVAILIWGLLLGRTNGNQMLILENEAYGMTAVGVPVSIGVFAGGHGVYGHVAVGVAVKTADDI